MKEKTRRWIIFFVMLPFFAFLTSIPLVELGHGIGITGLWFVPIGLFNGSVFTLLYIRCFIKPLDSKNHCVEG